MNWTYCHMSMIHFGRNNEILFKSKQFMSLQWQGRLLPDPWVQTLDWWCLPAGWFLHSSDTASCCHPTRCSCSQSRWHPQGHQRSATSCLESIQNILQDKVFNKIAAFCRAKLILEYCKPTFIYVREKFGKLCENVMSANISRYEAVLKFLSIMTIHVGLVARKSQFITNIF